MVQREKDPLNGASRRDVLISSEDAARLGIAEGDRLRLRSRPVPSGPRPDRGSGRETCRSTGRRRGPLIPAGSIPFRSSRTTTRPYRSSGLALRSESAPVEAGPTRTIVAADCAAISLEFPRETGGRSSTVTRCRHR
jgi:hypothetical protein